MFCLLDYKDTVILFRGFLVLFLMIVLGVSIAEGQLNSLTQRQECAYAFNVSCDAKGKYSIEILGVSYSVSAVYPVGEFINKDEGIIIKIPDHKMTIPKYMEFDCKKELALLALWAKLLVEECSKYTHSLDLYLTSLQQRFNVYTRQYR